jgi:hypothetical protein
MPSNALQDWSTTRQQALDELEQAHGAVGGTSRGRRYATLQINYAYAVLLSSQFQAFCRDLHSEAVDFVVASTSPRAVASALRLVMTQGRKLDAGNPNPGNIGSDFARFEMAFWQDVEQLDARASRRRGELDLLNTWRNAIAHQDWSKIPEQRQGLSLGQVRQWRSVCSGLAVSFDRAVHRRLLAMVGTSPW